MMKTGCRTDREMKEACHLDKTFWEDENTAGRDGVRRYGGGGGGWGEDGDSGNKD